MKVYQGRRLVALSRGARFAPLMLMALLVALPAHGTVKLILEPAARARLLAGLSAQTAERNADAEREFLAALALVEKSSDTTARTYLLNRIADVVRAQRRFSEAESIARGSGKLTRSRFAPMSFQAFDATYTLGWILLEQGSPRGDEALKVMSGAADILDTLSAEDVGESELIENRLGMGHAFIRLGVFARGERYLREAIPLLEKRGTAGRAQLANAEYWLGVADFSQKRYASSEQRLQRSLTLFEGNKHEDSEDVRNTRFLLGRSLWVLRRLPEAERELRRSLESAQKVEIVQRGCVARTDRATRDNAQVLDPETLASHALSLGGVLVELGKSEEGLCQAQKAYDLANSTPQPDTHILAEASVFMGIAYRRLNNAPQAIAVLRRAMSIYKNPSQDRVMRSLAASHLAELLWADGRYCESNLAYQTAIADGEATGASAVSLAEFRSQVEQIRVNGYCPSG